MMSNNIFFFLGINIYLIIWSAILLLLGFLQYYLCLNSSRNSSSVILPSPSASSFAIRASVFFCKIRSFTGKNGILSSYIGLQAFLCSEKRQISYGLLHSLDSFLCPAFQALPLWCSQNYLGRLPVFNDWDKFQEYFLLLTLNAISALSMPLFLSASMYLLKASDFLAYAENVSLSISPDSSAILSSFDTSRSFGSTPALSSTCKALCHPTYFWQKNLEKLFDADISTRRETAPTENLEHGSFIKCM